MRIEAFIVLVFIVIVILQIILFFKIWGMTNNVKEMRDYFLRKEDAKNKAEKDNYFFNSGEKVVYDGRIYEVVEQLSQGMVKCKEVETGRLYSLQGADLKQYN